MQVSKKVRALDKPVTGKDLVESTPALEERRIVSYS
jgi:hypothetical protein